MTAGSAAEAGLKLGETLIESAVPASGEIIPNAAGAAIASHIEAAVAAGTPNRDILEVVAEGVPDEWTTTGESLDSGTAAALAAAFAPGAPEHVPDSPPPADASTEADAPLTHTDIDAELTGEPGATAESGAPASGDADLADDETNTDAATGDTDPHPERDEPTDTPETAGERMFRAGAMKIHGELTALKQQHLVLKEAPETIKDEAVATAKFTELKTALEAVGAEIAALKDELAQFEDFHKFIFELTAMKQETAVLRRSVAGLYRARFNLLPDVEGIIPKSMYERVQDVVQSPFKRIIAGRFPGKGTDTLFPLTDEEKEVVLAEFRKAQEEHKHKRKDMILEIGIMAAMSALHEMEQMSHQAKQTAEAAARHAA